MSVCALDKKQLGNNLFKQEKYFEALNLYREAILENPSDYAIYSNASLCCLKLGTFEEAIQFASECIRLAPETFPKGYNRRALAYENLGMYKEASRDFERTIEIVPNDPLVKKEREECRKKLFAEKFKAAIRSDKFDLEPEKINNIDVDFNYNGPRTKNTLLGDAEFIERLISFFKEERKLHKRYLYQIMYEAKRVFEKEANFHQIDRFDSRVIICGDIHGQFFDLCEIFRLNGLPSDCNIFIFNGDFVDRGAHSVETVTTLLALKAIFPKCIYLTRGNHETSSVNRVNSFYTEVQKKYESETFEMFNKVFNTLPIGYVLEKKYLIVHGGLPKSLISIEELNKLDRFGSPELGSIISQILWSDPDPEEGIKPSPRGEGFLFGPDHTASFLKHNHLSKLIRSHVWEETGYKIHHGKQCITIFSAPNYIGTPSQGAYIILEKGSEDLKFVQFDAAKYQGKVEKPQPSVPTFF
jgi:serine/threonine-protein phosphatase 5